MNAGVMQPDLHFLERPLLLSRIQPDRHRRAGAERGEEIIVWGRRSIGSADLDRLVALQMEPADLHFLEKSGRIAAHRYVDWSLFAGWDRDCGRLVHERSITCS